MTGSRRLRSGFERPEYQHPAPRQRPSAPAAPAAPTAPAAPATLVVESGGDDDDDKGGGGEDEGDDDADSVMDYGSDDDILSEPPRFPVGYDPGAGSSSRPPPVPRRESKEDSKKSPVVEKCDHTIHPAYAAFYPHLLCPLCRLEKTINEGRRPAQILMEKGGQQAWIKEFNTTMGKDSDERKLAKKEYYSIIPQSRKRSGKPKPLDLHVDKDGNISFPRARTGAWNMIRELEMFRGVENAWNEMLSLGKLEGALRVRILNARKHDATAALTRWEKEYREAVSDSVIKHDENVSRKRARDNELALRDDFPGTHRRRYFTQEQEEWADAQNAAEGWTLESGACPQQEILPPRKRRRVGLRFDTHVYVRSDYGLNSGLFRPRPTVSDAASSSDSPPPGEMNPPPTRPHYTETTREGPRVDPDGRTGIRPLTIKDDRIDTSGWDKNWEQWKAYTAALEAEDERSEAQKATEIELLMLYDLLARLRHSGHQTKDKEVLTKAHKSLARALEANDPVLRRTGRHSPSLEDPEEQPQREMADEERRRAEQQPQGPGVAPRGGIAAIVAWVEHARGIVQEYLRRLAENTGL